MSLDHTTQRPLAEPAALRATMRVSIVTETYPPEVNGVATTLARVVQGLHRRGHDVQLVRPRQAVQDLPECSPRFTEVLQKGLPIPRYPHLRMGLPARRQLVQLWSQRRPDAVHIATEGPLGWSALQAALHLKLPVTSDFRTNFHAYSQHYGIGWLRAPILAYLRAFHNRCALTMVPTEALRSELQAAGFQRVLAVTRGVDTRQFSPERRSQALRAQWGVADDDLVVACVGRLAAEKNLALVRQAFLAIQCEQPRARLLLVGDGPMRDALAALVPRPIMAGQRLGHDLAAHYASADLFLFASLTETFGNVTAEAMASGLPVVAFAQAAAAQMIEPGHHGELVPAGDAVAFVAAAQRLARDPARRRRLGSAARRRTLAQDWDEVLGRFESVLAQALPPTSGWTTPPVPAAQAA